MPPVPMTRAEYEQKYGVAPVATPASSIDTTPSPIQMSREEYSKTYGVTPEGRKINNPIQNIIDRKPSFPANEDTSNPLGNIARTFGNIPSSTINLARLAIIDPVQNFIESDKAVLDIYKSRGAIDGTKDILGGFADTYLKAGEFVYGTAEKAYEALLDKPEEALSQTSSSLAKLGIEDPLFIPSILYGGGALGRKDIITKLASPVTRGADTSIPTVVTKVGNKAEETFKNVSAGLKEKAVVDTADEIYAVEQNYSKARKLNQYSNDGGAEGRMRIARSGVLDGSVTTDGIIRTKQPGGAVERYRAQTIDGYEDVVKKGLEREGAKVNLDEVRRALTLEVNRSGLEGADLVTAMNGIRKELAGLARRADESGNLFLSKLQDAKVGTTRNINYQTPPETATYRKAVARAYKNTIENKSNLNVKQVNDELAKYYKDIERLEGLDGLRVKGGKLGKYTAQISGNIGGGLIGGAVGGVPGAAIGTVVGGEITQALKGRAMSQGLSKVKEGSMPKSDVLENAKREAELPKAVDLKTPDPVVGVRKDIPKTKEIIEIEGQIKNNVRQQKLAIKAGDFTLVEKLKEIYQVLAERLKEVVKVLSEKGPPQRGFVRIGGETKSAPKSQPKSSKQSPSPKSTTQPETFKGYEDLSTKLLEKLKGRSTVSRQFIEDMTNQPDLKQAEKDLIRRVLGDGDKAPEYGMSHRPTEGPRAFDLTEKVNGEEMIPKDMYDKWYGSRGTDADKESIAALKVIKGNPEATVTIYRASPEGTFNTGDWVSLSKKYAEEHAAGNGTKVNSQVVKAKDLRWAADDINEFGYYPDKSSQQINVPDFANKVKSELLPLEVKEPPNLSAYRGNSGRYESINLPDELRGPVANYKEKVYESPIKTSAGGVHFNSYSQGTPEGYFAHSRIEDLPTETFSKSKPARMVELENKKASGVTLSKVELEELISLQRKVGANDGGTRRVIEIQSDLFQKGRLDNELIGGEGPLKEQLKKEKGLDKLEPYRNTWHERIIREEVKQAAKDGKTKLQFPTGETAMKIEGLGDTRDWYEIRPRLEGETTGEYLRSTQLTPDKLKVGGTIEGNNNEWIITDVLGDGKFKAVPKKSWDEYNEIRNSGIKSLNEFEDALGSKTRTSEETLKAQLDSRTEEFDISGKVDTENPIYKFYEKTVQKYLTNKYGGKVITDPQGVKWVEIDVKPEYKGLPVEAFGAGALVMGNDEK